jgi:beta-lactamase class A
MLPKKINLLIAAIFFITGLIFGLLTNFFRNDANNTIKNVSEQRQGGYDYINPLLECNNDAVNNEIKPFKNALVDFINSEKEKYSISLSSVYFRDLNNGPWIGINEKENFSPASMLKVPLMMSALKLAENNPDLLREKIKVTELSNNINQYIKPSQSIEAGKTYTIDELIYRMIVYSDNNAQAEIFNFIGDEATAKSYSDLGLVVPTLENQENFMSVKEYASFFRILYNASYLNKNFSEKSLGLLTKVEFKDGLAAGLPDGIVIANKFGERQIDETGEKQLHDCGIIYYYPSHPYLLCIMNRGNDFKKMSDFIKSISAFVYQQVSNQYK